MPTWMIDTTILIPANSTASVLSGCRTPADDAPYYCICPLEHDPLRFRHLFTSMVDRTPLGATPVTATGATTLATAASTPGSDGLSGGAIAGIVIGCV
uniref:Secreted protein n=1 Tax=Steinernema glaseri TaxID=37863 RepID=A0A1I8A0Z3_9BILA